MKALAERFYDQTARIEQMFLLAGIPEAIPHELADILCEMDAEELVSCFGEIHEDYLQDLENGQPDTFFDWLRDGHKYGFMIEFSTPVMTYQGNGTSYSWGRYRKKWMYGDTFDVAIEKGFAWVESVREKEKASSGRHHDH